MAESRNGQQLTGGRLEQLTLILEPSTEGDQQAVYAGKRVVAQLKARSTDAAWSLQQVIRSVLPDLYLAVGGSQPETEYWFVTEGRRGDWAAVETMFRSLPEAPAAGVDPLAGLDDSTELKFRRKSARADTFWDPGPYSPRRLVRKIVDTVRQRKPAGDESDAETCRKVWHLLRRFRFVGGQKQMELQAAVDNWLLAHIGSAARLAEKRDHILLDLGRRACAGDAPVCRDEFFAQHGLDGTPLTDWFTLRLRAREYLAGVFRRKQVDPSDDARPQLTSDLLAGWTLGTPILVLTGESGTGKSWHGYRMLLAAAESGDVSLLVDSRADADQDFAEAANTFWHSVAGRDEALPLSRLRPRLQQLDPNKKARQVALLIDNVGSLDEALRLVQADWEGWSIRLIMTCLPQLARAVSSRIGERGRVVTIPDFTLGELQQFLSQASGMNWEEVPYEVRKTLRRPLLAMLFRDLVPGGGWQPQNEYELYERSWAELGKHGVQPLELDALRELMRSVLTGGSRYPWTSADLRAAGLDNAALSRLTATGWLMETSNGGYAVWHERLLNWGIAQTVVYDLQHHPERIDSQTGMVSELLTNPRLPSGVSLAYVPMDVLWLLASPENPSPKLSRRLVGAFEAALGGLASDALYKHLLPTLGRRSLPFLQERLRTVSTQGSRYDVRSVVGGLAATGVEELPAFGANLLADTCPKIQRAAACLLARHPSASALDRLWAIHNEAIRDPASYLWQHDSKWTLYEDTFAALRECARLNPAWLEAAVRSADPRWEAVHDLGYLVSASRIPALWRRCKRDLMSKVDDDHQRSLATCILTFRDRAEEEWLEERIGVRKDLLGPVALQALAVIDPRRAVSALDRLSEDELYGTRKWCFSELHLRLPDEVMAYFAERLRRHSDPWKFALVLQGDEDTIDGEAFDFMLDRLAESLEGAGAPGEIPRIPANVRTAFQFMNSVSRPHLLDRLRWRRGTKLETLLTDRLLALGPESGEYTQREKHDVLRVLAHIGGDGFSRVLDDWLEQGDWQAKLDAAKLARWRVSATTIELLTQISLAGGVGIGDEHQAHVQGYAAAALAAHGCWAALVGYYLHVGLHSWTIIEECCATPEEPVDDATLGDAAIQMRGAEPPSPGAVLAVALSGRGDFLPRIRTELHGASPGTEIASACLLALHWLRDKEPDVVPLVVRHLPTDRRHAINALLANGNSAANEALLAELRRTGDPELAVLLANDERYRVVAVGAIQQALASPSEFRFQQYLGLLAARLTPEALRAAADCHELFAFAEEIGYAPYETFRVSGEKPAALRIVAQRDPESALRVAIARLQDAKTPDGELYVHLVGDLMPKHAVSALLEVVLAKPASRVIRAIGRELRRLDGAAEVRSWLADPVAERRLAACRVAGMLAPAADLYEGVRARMDDPDRHVAAAAKDALHLLRRGRTVEEIGCAIIAETDLTHRWVLFDALAAVADPGDDASPAILPDSVHEFMSPAIERHVSERIRDQRKKLNESLDKFDRDRRS